MDMQRPSPSPQSQDEGEGDENSSCLQMALSYDVDPLLEWLARFDDVTDEDEAIMPVSSLPAPPEMVPMTLPLSGLPNKWLGINLPATGNITDSLAERIHLDKHVEKMKKWMGKRSQQLERVKKGEHRANKPPTPSGRATSSRLPHHFRTNVARNARDLLANNFFASSVQGFMDLPLEGRLAFYGAKLLAPDMISIPDSSTIATSLSTHCISTLVDPHARSFLAISTLNLLSPKHCKLWREASRYFWLKNSFIINITHISTILDRLPYRVKAFVGTLHITLDFLHDLDFSASSEDVLARQAHTLQTQSQGLRRLVKECYSMSSLRLRIQCSWPNAQLRGQEKGVCSCRDRSCSTCVKYSTLDSLLQHRVEYLLWLFYASLKCPQHTVAIDIEHTNLQGGIDISTTPIDYTQLEEVGRAVHEARRPRQRRHQLEKAGEVIVERYNGPFSEPSNQYAQMRMSRFVDSMMAENAVVDETFGDKYLAFKETYQR
ncbi:hypothetical protein AUEXF2481DRAFT_24411 [Aureobasidium subglaciale EXF-2481]|uniref:Uncharacterized protein n=1 Tax=Aureobasidium subglaciale (strain EXF-2481) TaxID=1043005 RepID=A0A074YQU8_AURSE|nr:uncharacterized protein AUEXF2481DRAFT_24411 [Aureobasidium subglaciale EXF-2481]KAI5207962.1 hypothetical protein E4T38_03022 [Aureobasidium subglaciale]KAI5226881.1 hypothetical protein E4T40_02796 [Aureobasidium subglaciale]KAI5230080.1 hypothetical protein E4T41_03019 [Aureobasidium subglaciale]KAI5264695.1 hypothetical protein E4T46_02797 [Aureobasidium subglaciale]KER00051.1 hypothetical protein AUEXF2481DRAFT_24411 [Aureobasidium subglaciale EXF-2481]